MDELGATLEIYPVIYSLQKIIFTTTLSISAGLFEQQTSYIPNRLKSEHNQMITAPYTEEEIKLVLFKLPPTNAPSITGYPFFIRKI